PARLGGGGRMAGWVKLLPGYATPHEAGRLEVYGYDHRAGYAAGGRVIPGTDVEALAMMLWETYAPRVARVVDKPKGRDVRHGDLKGHEVFSSGTTKEGHAKEFYAFASKLRQDTMVVALFVDARESRLWRDLFKQICGNIVLKGG
ncbi:MAG: hypothetical protein ACREID_00165, partial [Planctomycetota bacterium]